MDILLIYQYCTFGGVERVILNRAEVFKEYGFDIRISVGYLYDSGALLAFRRYVHNHHLDEILIPFLIPSYDSIGWKNYDLVLVIDTPQILQEIKDLGNVCVECHTSYKENQQYLRNVPDGVRAILVPSASFKLLLQQEYPVLPKIYVIPNPVAYDFFESLSLSEHKMLLPRRPLSYIGRLDKLKNIEEVLNIFNFFKDIEEIMYVLIGHGVSDKKFIIDLKEKGLISKTFLRDQIDFDDVPSLVNFTMQHKGIYLSASTGESFGLGPAEFMSGGVPVLLSDIPAHRELVDNDDNFLYNLGDVTMAKEKILNILHHWDKMSTVIQVYSMKFAAEVFLEAWLSFLNEQGFEIRKDQNRK